jgi:hypothetical protein
MLTRSYLSNLLILLFVSQLFITTGFSQITSYLDSLDGKFALQFQIADNFQLSSFQGTTLSGKYHFSCWDAVRLGLSIELGDSESETKIDYLDTSAVAKSKEDGNKFGLTLKSQYIRYFRGTKDISFFGGIGPFISFNDQSFKRVIEENGIDITRETEASGFSFGLDLIIGVDWMFSNYMSLSAEYGLNFSYRSSEINSKDDSAEANHETTAFNISGNNINFGITVYF